MMKSTLFCLFGIVFVTFGQERMDIDNNSGADSLEYHLVWSDEFDKDGIPDPQKWTYETGFVRNEELQWYQPDNAFCENGLLIIEGVREVVPNPGFDPNSNDWRKSRKEATYTSASVTTKGLHAWTYGRFEVKAKIKTQPGLWPAIWTLGYGQPWPVGGEIDIMEYYDHSILANVAWAGKEKTIWDDTKRSMSHFGDEKWDERFHVWRMDWDSESIKLYVDDELLNSTNLSQTLNERGEVVNPFHIPHFLILNLAIGGKAGGDPSKTPFPSRYEIDYVRIYQSKPKQ